MLRTMGVSASGRPEDLGDDLFIRRLRGAFWIILASSAVMAVEDVWVQRQALGLLLTFKTLHIAVLAALLWALQFQAVRTRPVVVGLLGVAITCAAAAATGVLRGDVGSTRLVLVVIAMAAAAVLPWGLVPQIAAAIIAALAIAWNGYMVTGSVAGASHALPAGLLVGFVVVLFVAHEFARYRTVLEKRNIELREYIADHRLTEQALQHSERYYRSLLDNVSDLITIIDRDGFIRYATPSHQRVLGYRPEELVGTPTTNLVHPDDLPALAESWAVALVDRANTAPPVEWRARHRDGSWRDLETVGRGLGDDPTLTIMNSRDVTDRKQVEAALRESEENYRELFENATDIVYTQDIDWNFIWINRAAERLTGYTREEARGRSGTLILAPEHIPRALEATRRKLAGEPTPAYEVDLITKDGQRIPVELNSRLIFRDGQPVGIQGIARDITSRKRVEAELQRAKEAAEAASRAKSEFLANVSHEIRTPMNGILGMTELALQSDLSTEQRECIEMVKACGDSLLNVINDILDFSRIEAGKLRLDSKEYGLRAHLDDVVKGFALRAREKGVALTWTVTPSTPDMVLGDVNRLRQVLINLVGNAIKFTGSGAVSIDVSSDAAPTDNDRRAADSERWLHFAVRDTGIGVPSEKHATIFEAFEQVDGSTTRHFGGTGLGLAISKRLVDLMGGHIWVESEVGQGSTFHFTIPLEVAAHRQPPEPCTPATATVLGSRDVGHLRVLLAEDNAVNQKLVMRLLEQHGHTVVVVNNGREAVAAVERQAFDVVLMDIQMPEMGGLEATAEIRRREANGTARASPVPHLPIVALTAHAMHGDEARCLAAGMDGYVAKPIRMPVLLAEMVRVLAVTAPNRGRASVPA